MYYYQQYETGQLTKKRLDNYFDLQKTRIITIKNQLLAWDKYNSKARSILSGIYHRSLLSAIQRNISFQRDCKLFLIKEYNSPLFIEFNGKYERTSCFTSLLYYILDSKKYFLTECIARFINYVKVNHSMLFNKIKS